MTGMDFQPKIKIVMKRPPPPRKYKALNDRRRMKMVRDTATLLNRTLTVSQIAERHGVSRQYVSQLKKRLIKEGCNIPRLPQVKPLAMSRIIRLYRISHKWQFNSKRDLKNIRHTNCLACGFGYRMTPHPKLPYEKVCNQWFSTGRKGKGR